ncbi:MAG: efflux RND transporter periplasmic adaptor subunit [Bacteroidales bacterium]
MENLRVKPIVLTGILLVTVFACGKKETEDTQSDTQEVYPVKVQKIQKEDIVRTLEYTADLTAFEEVYLAPSSPGRIDRIHVDVGDRVSKGQTLLEMDRSNLIQAKTQLQNARSNFRRLDTLAQLGSISEQQYEQAKTEYEVAKEQVESLQENTTMQSPINGIVTGRYYEPKEIYSGQPNTEEGKAAVVTIMQINPLKAFIHVSSRHFSDVQKGMNTRIKVDKYPDLTLDGEVSRVHPTVNRGTRTFQVEVLVDNPEEKLRPGMFASLTIELEEAEVLVAPAIGVMKEEGTNNRYIFVNDDGEAKKIPVRIGKRFDDKLEIISEKLNEGMELIVAGQGRLLDGADVKITE